MIKKNRIKAYGALAVVCVVWGTTYLGISVGVDHFPPLMFSVVRLLLAGSLIAIVMFSKIQWSELTPTVLLHQTLAGLFLFGIGNGLVSLAQVGINSGTASVIGSMIPIWVILFNRIFKTSEQVTPGILLGTISGLGGIYLIFSEHAGFRDSGALIGMASMFAAGIAFAGGSVWIKSRKLALDPFGSSAVQMLTGGLLLLPLSLATEDWSTAIINTKTILVIAYLVTFGSIIGYFCYLYAIRRLPVTIVSLYAYVNPIVAVLLGGLLLSEPLSGRVFAGMLITLGGVYIVNRGMTLSELLPSGLRKKETPETKEKN